jgi:HlyD family secretion protein
MKCEHEQAETQTLEPVMDRPLDNTTLRRNRLARIGRVVLPLLVLAAVLVWLPGWVRPSVTRARIRTAPITTGPIEAVITASGTVEPEIERVLSSPLDARVLRILKRPGAALSRGDAVVELDVSGSVLSLEKAVKNLKIKHNEQAQTRLSLDKSLAELDGRIEVKRLELQSLEAKLASNQALFKDGLVARGALGESELAVKQAGIELVQLGQQRRNAERATSLQADGLALERESLGKEVTEARRLLDLATTKSDRDGVLTWVLPQEGTLVRRGDVIARIADLTSFRVAATVSDVHAGRIRPGMPVVVKANDVDLEGTVAEVLPSVENGVFRFTVALTERSHTVLRPSLRVDVLVVTDRRPRTLRVRRGPFADGTGARQAFIIRGDRAVRTDLTIGLAGFDAVEIVSGANEGDEVIISDMRDYLHVKEIAVK